MVPCCHVLCCVSCCGVPPCLVVGCRCSLCVLLCCAVLLVATVCCAAYLVVSPPCVARVVACFLVVVCVAVCCAVSLGAVLRRAAALCSPLRCVVVHSVVLSRSFPVLLRVVSCPQALFGALGSCACPRCMLSCLPALRALCCVCFGVVRLCVLLFAAVLCAVCVPGCGAVRSLFSPLFPSRPVRCCAALCWCGCVVLFAWSGLFLTPGVAVRCCRSCGFLQCCALLLRVVPCRPVPRCVVLRPPARVAGSPVMRCVLLCGSAPPLCPAPLCCAPWCCVAVWCCGVLSCCLVCILVCVGSLSPTSKTTAKFVKILFRLLKKMKSYTPQHTRRQAARPCLHHGRTCDPAMVAVSWKASAL